MKKSLVSILSLAVVFTFVSFARAEMDHSQHMNMENAEPAKEATHKKKHSTRWTYKGKFGPSNWGDIDAKYETCKSGKEQSPVNLTNAEKAKEESIEFHYNNTPLKAVNNGHSVKVERNKGSYVIYKGSKYNLLQFHFHSESEHTINNEHAPIESHFVHANDDNELLVIGVMIEAGNGNMSYGAIFNNLPRLSGDKSVVKAKINAINLLPIDKKTYYSYKGSLTTPPCSENVTWIVMAKSVTIPKSQINNFKEIYKANNRPVQRINNRELTISEKE